MGLAGSCQKHMNCPLWGSAARRDERSEPKRAGGTNGSCRRSGLVQQPPLRIVAPQPQGPVEDAMTPSSCSWTIILART